MSELSKITNTNIETNIKAAIELENVKLTLPSTAGNVDILNGIFLKVLNGESIGVVGPSGGGKSTMLMVISGLERASSGLVRTAGIDLETLNEDELALFRRDKIGIIFQDFHLIPTMSALENVVMPLEFSCDPDAHDRARESLDAVGLNHRLEHYPGQLSGGEQQRVSLARAFATRPSILLADEPTGNLDKKTGHTVMDLLFELHSKSDTTMLLISHDNELASRCNRTVTLIDGRIEKNM